MLANWSRELQQSVLDEAVCLGGGRKTKVIWKQQFRIVLFFKSPDDIPALLPCGCWKKAFYLCLGIWFPGAAGRSVPQVSCCILWQMVRADVGSMLHFKDWPSSNCEGEERCPVSNELLIFAKSLTIPFLSMFSFNLLFFLQTEDYHEICNLSNCWVKYWEELLWIVIAVCKTGRKKNNNLCCSELLFFQLCSSNLNNKMLL